MEIALCGLPRAGKTTLWSILTGTPVPSGARAETRRGVARVLDQRLETVARLFKPKKLTHATVTFDDLAAMERGSARADNPLLAPLRTADALLLVLRAWDDPADPHPEGSIDPARDLSLVETEFLLADHDIAERRLERLEGLVKKAGRDEDRREQDLLRRVLEGLEREIPIRGAELTAEEQKTLRGYGFLSGKPLIVALNVGEEHTAELSSDASGLGIPAERRAGREFVALSAKIEQEIASLPEADAAAFRADLGIAEPALDRLIHASYRALGLISFFTASEDEVRAWPLRDGSTARQAAGTIHTDLERAFIRAEVIPWDKLVEAGSFAHAREKGWLRLEGKDYVVHDGEIVHIRHSA
ncbi:MAG: YchF family ATPase [Acidobacteria bacterium]|nr:YchF family ATPase [Acidobacteriota bacterium]